MTLIKSLLLGSAAGVVAVSAAQAADLPTRKGPVAAEYVRICSITVAGAPVVGFVLPGSDTCIKFSGYVTAQVEGGNLSNGYFLTTPSAATSSQRVVGTQQRDSFGYTTRFNFTIDAVSNTAYGPLVSHAELQFNHGNGFDNTGNQQFAGSDGGLNRAYVTWAGLTAGKIDSFFSFTGGGLAWANFFSPDRKGFNQPDVLAYTASFGGGFSATISLEDAANGATNNPANSGTLMGYNTSAVQGGMRAPDIVGSLDVKQAWGAAHLGAVAHNVRATSLNNFNANGDASQLNTWGWALDAGVSFNIPNMAGSTIGLTGAWSRNATWYSGLPDGMWGENGAVNGNGQAMVLADAYSNPGNNGTWATPTAWSITGWAQFAVSPQVTLGLEGSYGQVSWSGQNALSTVYNSKSFIVGGVAHYDPVKNLDFEFELLYQGTQSTQPSGYQAGVPGACGAVGQNTCSWQGNASGFAARFEVTRSF